MSMMQTRLLSQSGQLEQPHAVALSRLFHMLPIQMHGDSGFTKLFETHGNLTGSNSDTLTMTSLASAGGVSRCGHALD